MVLATVITIINYNRHMFIVQATGVTLVLQACPWVTSFFAQLDCTINDVMLCLHQDLVTYLSTNIDLSDEQITMWLQDFSSKNN